MVSTRRQSIGSIRRSSSSNGIKNPKKKMTRAKHESCTGAKSDPIKHKKIMTKSLNDMVHLSTMKQFHYDDDSNSSIGTSSPTITLMQRRIALDKRSVCDNTSTMYSVNKKKEKNEENKKRTIPNTRFNFPFDACADVDEKTGCMNCKLCGNELMMASLVSSSSPSKAATTTMSTNNNNRKSPSSLLKKTKSRSFVMEFHNGYRTRKAHYMTIVSFNVVDC